MAMQDVSRFDKVSPVTTDETLYEIAVEKNRINTQILQAIKETAIDCSLYSKSSDENLVCYDVGKIESNQFGSYPSFESDRKINDDLATTRITWTATEVTIGKIKYALNQATMELYDYDSYLEAVEKGGQPIKVGTLAKRGKGYAIV
jgi:hypothetical protein